MSRSIVAAAFVVAVAVPSWSWSQVADPANGTNANGGPVAVGSPGLDPTLTDRSANPTSDLGTSNPSASGTMTNPTLGTNSGVFDAQRTTPEAQRIQATPGGTTYDAANAAAPNDWRMVRHNGRWWYWTPNNSWLYRNGDRWMAFVPRNGPQYYGSAAVDRNQRYEAGYRGETQSQGDARLQTGAGLRVGAGQPLGQAQIDPNTGARTNLSTSANTLGFEPTRPLAPTANELQGFYQQQGLRATPYGGTMGGAQNATPLGGGATRSGTGAAGPATFGTPQTNIPGASPLTNSPGNPGAIGSPGNPAASGPAGTGATGAGAGAGGTTSAGGAGGTSGASGTGAAGTSGGAGGSGS
ncbi:MAG: hypothetical protein AB7G28_23010 [Pirellulales bacterium]